MFAIVGLSKGGIWRSNVPQIWRQESRRSQRQRQLKIFLKNDLVLNFGVVLYSKFSNEFMQLQPYKPIVDDYNWQWVIVHNKG